MAMHPHSKSPPAHNCARSAGLGDLWRRIAPFARKDLRTSVRSAATGLFVVLALFVSIAMSLGMSSASTAARLRFDLGIEARPTPHAMRFTADEHATAQRAHQELAEARRAVLDDLRLRIDYAVTASTHRGGDAPRVEMLTPSLEVPALTTAATHDAYGTHAALAPLKREPGATSPFGQARQTLLALMKRESFPPAIAAAGIERATLTEQLRRSDSSCELVDGPCRRILDWIEAGEGAPASPLLADLTRGDWASLYQALTRADAWYDDCHPLGEMHVEASVLDTATSQAPMALSDLPLPPAPWRYTNPAPVRSFLFFFGGLCWMAAWLLLTVATPAAATYRTATEREMGTFPNLRMTGLSSRELAAAIAVASNLVPLVGGLLSLAFSALAWTCIGFGGFVGATIPGLGCGLLVGLSMALVLGQSYGRRKNPSMLAVAVGSLSLLGGVAGLIGLGTSTASWSMFGPGAMGLGGILTSGLPLHLSQGDGLTVTSTATVAVSLFMVTAAGGAVWLSQRVWARKLENNDAHTLTRAEALGVVVTATLGCLLWLLEHGARWDWSLEDWGLAVFFVDLCLVLVIASVALASTRRPALAGVRPSAEAVRRSFGWGTGIAAIVSAVSVITVVVIPGADDLPQALVSGASTRLLAPPLVQAALTCEVILAVILLRARTSQSVLRTMITGMFLAGGNALLTLFTVALVGANTASPALAALPFVAQPATMIQEGIAPIWVGLVVLLWLASAAALLLVLSGRGPMGTSYDDELPDDEDDDDDSWDEPGPPVIH
jgi:hypothetical protein